MLRMSYHSMATKKLPSLPLIKRPWRQVPAPLTLACSVCNLVGLLIDWLIDWFIAFNICLFQIDISKMKKISHCSKKKTWNIFSILSMKLHIQEWGKHSNKCICKCVSVAENRNQHNCLVLPWNKANLVSILWEFSETNKGVTCLLRTDTSTQNSPSEKALLQN